MSLSPIYCSECRAQNVPGAKFCVACGQVMRMPETPLDIVNASGTGLLPQESLLNKRYSILKLVGSGGMGAVYKAVYKGENKDGLVNGQLVAIKEMRQSSLTPQERDIATEQFNVEAAMLDRLKHDSLPRFYDHFPQGNRWYLVMDFIEGETLDERLRMTPGRKLPPPEVVNIGIQLCKVLDYLHKLQPPVIFRDLKPSNVMLTPEGRLYLIDFGIARIFKPGQAKDTKAYGSIGYSAPEQFDREQTTDQADIYSLGITLHEILSGSIPARTPFNMPRLSFAGQPALERLAALIMRMIELDKDKRPASIEKVGQELESIRDGLKQALYIPSAAHSTVPPTQYTSQPEQEAPRVAPTQYVPPPMGGTVAVPSYTESAQRPVSVAAVRPAVRRSILTIGNNVVTGTIVAGVLYVVVSLAFGLLLLLTSSSPLSSNIFPDMSAGPSFAYLIILLFFCIPFYVGARYGPLAGLIVAVIGALPVDFLLNPQPLWFWLVGSSAALGFIPGLAFFRTRGVYTRASNILLAVFLSIAGIVVWNLIRVIGIFQTFPIDPGAFLPALLTNMVQLVAVVSFVILLIVMNRVTKARAS